jgi:hypothetical protein
MAVPEVLGTSSRARCGWCWRPASRSRGWPASFHCRRPRPLFVGLPVPTWPTRLGLIRSLSPVGGVIPHSAAATRDLQPGRCRPRSPLDGRTTGSWARAWRLGDLSTAAADLRFSAASLASESAERRTRGRSRGGRPELVWSLAWEWAGGAALGRSGDTWQAISPRVQNGLMATGCR